MLLQFRALLDELIDLNPAFVALVRKPSDRLSRLLCVGIA